MQTDNDSQEICHSCLSIVDTDIKHAIAHIHASPYRLVLNFAGAGSLALWMLHSVSGSSHTVLEATDHYAATSLSDFLGRAPEKFVSVETAIAMAQRAYERAAHLAGAQRANLLLGVGCTATIATNYMKQGEHRCAVAVQNMDGITTFDLRMKKGLRDRTGEELLISQMLLCAIANGCGLPMSNPLSLSPGEMLREQHVAFTEPVSRLLVHAVRTVTVYPDGRRVTDEPVSGAILPGSFNPLHEGHTRLAEAASEMLKKTVIFEISVVNTDKGNLTANEIEERLQQFRESHTVVLTQAPLFHDKASLFPGCVFVVGYDTARRLVDPYYYGGETSMCAAMNDIRAAGCSFVVAGRLEQGTFRVLADLSIPPAFSDLFTELPEEHFRMDLSSTQLREAS
jgi:hypothetical protein